MTHIAVSEHQDETTVQWMEKVTDQQYNAAPHSQPAKTPQGTTRPSGPLQQRLAPGLARLTDEVLFGEVWRRTELSPRDRSLVTIAVLIATGKSAQLAGHLVIKGARAAEVQEELEIWLRKTSATFARSGAPR